MVESVQDTYYTRSKITRVNPKKNKKPSPYKPNGPTFFDQVKSFKDKKGSIASRASSLSNRGSSKRSYNRHEEALSTKDETDPNSRNKDPIKVSISLRKENGGVTQVVKGQKSEQVVYKMGLVGSGVTNPKKLKDD